ncbi:FAD/NAD(P)-binding domain-containing protein [Streptomyces sp. RKAG293]|uniref:FAD/NAD(P)-binding protein n=1 Tax=Streptomyces sp. RKAG293 TaxID=2893403 RepID=UPI0020334253|nr:FAD/NAD(P)-binding domain-containing protein [Streptomyces sp. RKAG293]MCM2424136.1 FAD/NAD(P)-binding protein [Streptomyces sp. RKAG293]
MSAHRFTVCVVGAGPRGLSVLERLCANERASAAKTALSVHVVDPARPGAGQVWRTDQPRDLLMNTVASQVTLYTDDSVEMAGPVTTGPSLLDWARRLAALDRLQEIQGGYDDRTLAEARALGADSYPTRALYGCYLEDAFRRVVAAAPAHLSVTVHRSRAVALDDVGGEHGGLQQLTLADGTRLPHCDAVVLTLGHLRSTRTEAIARQAEQLRLTHLAPANPADVDLSVLAPGQPVLLRGLGLNFFDYMALLTTGRGGVFEDHRTHLRYRPSGREPHLIAGSRRGVPYHARGQNQKGVTGRHTPRLLTPHRIGELTWRHQHEDRLEFLASLWPLIAQEVESVYYETLLRAQGRTAHAAGLVTAYLRAADGPERCAVLDRFAVAPRDRWSWESIAHPFGTDTFSGPAAFRERLLAHLADDIRRARAGNVRDPHKAALDVLRDLRNEIRLVVDHAGLDGDSHRDELDGWYTGLNAFVSIGPPVSRIEEMTALIDAGVLDIVGSNIRVTLDPTGPAFLAHSPAVPGAVHRATALIEARLPEPDLRHTADPLLRHLLATGQCRPFRIPAACGRLYETGGLDVTRRPYRLVDAQGRPHPRRFAFGVPTEAVHWATAAGVRPGVNSVTLGDSDAVARAVLALSPARPHTHDHDPLPDHAPANGRRTNHAPADGQLTEHAPAEGRRTDHAPANGRLSDGAPAEGRLSDHASANGRRTDHAPAEGQLTESTPADGRLTEVTT